MKCYNITKIARFRWCSATGLGVLRTKGAAPRSRSNRGFVKSLASNDDTIVSIAFHFCSGLKCGDAPAIILLARPGHSTKSIRLLRQLNTVTKADLRAGLLPFLGEIAQEARPLRTAITD